MYQLCVCCSPGPSLIPRSADPSLPDSKIPTPTPRHPHLASLRGGLGNAWPNLCRCPPGFGVPKQRVCPKRIGRGVPSLIEQTASRLYLLRIFGWTCHHMIEGKIQNPLTGNLGQNSFRRFYDASMWWSGQVKITTAWFLPGIRVANTTNPVKTFKPCPRYKRPELHGPKKNANGSKDFAAPGRVNRRPLLNITP